MNDKDIMMTYAAMTATAQNMEYGYKLLHPGEETKRTDEVLMPNGFWMPCYESKQLQLDSRLHRRVLPRCRACECVIAEDGDCGCKH